jgi:hypothetical protein
MMNRLALALVLSACRSPADCPAASDIAGVRAEAEIIATHCREDGWTQKIADCLRESKTEIKNELCLKQLTLAQQKELREDLSELGAEQDKVESAKALAAFERGLGELDLSGPVGACAGIKDGITELRAAARACSRADSLVLFGRHQQVVALLGELRAATKTCEQTATALQKLADEPCR